MIKFQEIEITLEGRVYFKHWLTAISGLCGIMLPIVMSEGTIHALVPEGTPNSRAARLREGGLTDFDLDTRWLYPHVESFLRRGKSNLFVAQDIWADSSDYDLACPFQFKSTDGVSIYYCLGSPITSTELLSEVFRRTVSFVVVMFLMKNGRDIIEVANRRDIGDEFIKLSDEIGEILVQAFDDESYVIWRRAPF